MKLDSLILAILAACMIGFMAFSSWWMVERDRKITEQEMNKKWQEGYLAGKKAGR
jgi:hypothetical protein